MTPWMTEQDCAMKDFEYTFQFQKTEEHFDQLWQMKSSARESLKDWLLASSVTPKIAETCANACSELIENCIKYAQNYTRAGVLIHVNQPDAAEKADIIIETFNRSDPSHHACLSESIAAINQTGDLKMLFVQKLLNPSYGQSHLGLVKLMLETKGRMEFLPAENHIAHVRLRMEANNPAQEIIS